MNSFHLKKYEIIDDRTKYLINGYIRVIQSLFDESNGYYNITTYINQICSIYYFCQYDSWNVELKSYKFTINGNTASHTGYYGYYGYATVFLSNIVEKGEHHWKFKVKKYSQDSNLIFGIWNIKHDPLSIINDKWIGNTPNSSYAFDFSCAELNIHSSKNEWTGQETYGVICSRGSIIQISVDFNRLQLSFTINDINYGKAFDIKHGKYLCAISSNGKGNAIDLLCYNQTC